MVSFLCERILRSGPASDCGCSFNVNVICWMYNSVVTRLLKSNMGPCDQNCNMRNKTRRKRLSLHTLSLGV